MHRAARAAVVISLATLLSRVLGFVRETVMAAVFGATVTADAYLVAQTVPLMLSGVATAVGGSVLLPAVARLSARDPERADRVAATVLLGMAVCLLLATAATWILAPWVVAAVAPGFPAEGRRLAVVLTRWSAPSLFFLGLAAGLIAALQARRSFILPAFVGVVQNVLLIGALLSAGAIGGVTGVAAATGVAALGQVALLLPGLRPAGYRLHPVPDWREPEVRALPGLLWPVIAVSLAGQFAPVLQRVIGSGLDEGSIAALNYATKLYTFPAGIFALAISTTLYPQLAETAEGAVAGRSRDFLATLQRGLRLIAFLLLPAAAGLAVLREPLVRLLFQRGAFDAAATEATAFALGFFALGAVAPAGCLEFTNRALYALRETRLPLLGSLVNLGVTVGVSLLLLRALGHGALALATSVGTVTALACQLWLLRRRLGRLGGRRLLGAALRMLAATAALAAAVAGWQALVGPRLPDGLRADLAVVAGGVVVGGTVYAVLSVLLGLEELGLILDLVAGVWRRAVPAAVRRRLPPLVRAWIRSARRRSVA